MSSEDYRKSSIFQTGSFDLDFPIPDLIGTTEILTEEHRLVSIIINIFNIKNYKIIIFLFLTKKK